MKFLTKVSYFELSLDFCWLLINLFFIPSFIHLVINLNLCLQILTCMAVYTSTMLLKCHITVLKPLSPHTVVLLQQIHANHDWLRQCLNIF